MCWKSGQACARSLLSSPFLPTVTAAQVRPCSQVDVECVAGRLFCASPDAVHPDDCVTSASIACIKKASALLRAPDIEFSWLARDASPEC